MLKTTLLGNERHEKVDVTLSFLVSVRVLKPRSVATKIEIRDRVNIGTEKRFENELTYILFSIPIPTEYSHIKNLYGRAALDDLSKKTDHLHPH